MILYDFKTVSNVARNTHENSPTQHMSLLVMQVGVNNIKTHDVRSMAPLTGTNIKTHDVRSVAPLTGTNIKTHDVRSVAPLTGTNIKTHDVRSVAPPTGTSMT